MLAIKTNHKQMTFVNTLAIVKIALSVTNENEIPMRIPLTA